jgi:hypothetical protein
MKKFVLYSLMLGALVSTTACRNIEEDGQTIFKVEVTETEH